MNTNIDCFESIITPKNLLMKLPINNRIKANIVNSRKLIEDILLGKSHKKLIIVGPCSIHNVTEAKIYADRLLNLQKMVSKNILLVMRVYFEKPRSTTGWKGLINDPDLNNTTNINKGLHIARELLLYINFIGIPCACELLDTISPQYISDLISWGAIGARTCESQIHRQMASGVSMPIGFKNTTSGNIDLAINSLKSIKSKHTFLGINDFGLACICKTLGNKYGHIILRGSEKSPNYYEKIVDDTKQKLEKMNIQTKIIVDCSHGNSNKNYKNQKIVFKDVIRQIIKNNLICGLMLESNLYEGKQSLDKIINLKYGVSITDSCISFEETEKLILEFDELL